MHKSIEQEEYLGLPKMSKQMRRGFFGRVVEYGMLIQQLFAERRLRNALISSCTVNLCQQLCGSEPYNFHPLLIPLGLVSTVCRNKADGWPGE